MSKSIKIPELVAHRGYAACFPENTLLALEEALRCGAPWIEFDVQCCEDGTPVLCHDASLQRTTGEKITLLDVPYIVIEKIQAVEPARFGKRFAGVDCRIPTLAQAVALIRAWPQARAMVEIKTESLDRFGIEVVVNQILADLAPVSSQCVIISYSAAALEHARRAGAPAIGWVLTRWSQAARREAEDLSPHVLICNYKKIPRGEALWPGPWQWCLYEVVDPDLAAALYRRGANLIETMNIGAMSKDPRLKAGAISDDHSV